MPHRRRIGHITDRELSHLYQHLQGTIDARRSGHHDERRAVIRVMDLITEEMHCRRRKRISDKAKNDARAKRDADTTLDGEALGGQESFAYCHIYARHRPEWKNPWGSV
jgi:hypothetical protein